METYKYYISFLGIKNNLLITEGFFYETTEKLEYSSDITGISKNLQEEKEFDFVSIVSVIEVKDDQRP